MPRRKDHMTVPISALLAERVLVEPYGKKFIVTHLKPRRRKKSSRAQKNRQEKFKEAVAYAKQVLKDPKRKKAYDRNLKGHRNAFQAVVAEYMNNTSIS
jgi:hypothetical protein